jgi:hypothetical protein
MARTTTNDKLLLNDGRGNLSDIATGIFQTKAIDMSERRRLSLTASFGGGFTGTLLIEGTDELGNCSVAVGTGAGVAMAGAGAQPGINGVSGAKYWTALPSGTVLVTNSTTSLQTQLNDVNCRWIRVSFNKGVTTAIGSGTIELFITAKNQ